MLSITIIYKIYIYHSTSFFFLAFYLYNATKQNIVGERVFYLIADMLNLIIINQNYYIHHIIIFSLA